MQPHPQPPFPSLLARARRGETDALDALIQDCYPRVQQLVHTALAKDLRQSHAWINARFSTGDIVQEVFGQMIRDLGQFRGSSRDELISYLASSVRHRLLDAMRFHEAERRDGRRSGGTLEEQTGGPSATEPPQLAEASEERALVQEEINAFQPKERDLLRLRIEHQATFQELAERLDYPSMFAARRAYFACEARLALRLRKRIDP